MECMEDSFLRHMIDNPDQRGCNTGPVSHQSELISDDKIGKSLGHRKAHTVGVFSPEGHGIGKEHIQDPKLWNSTLLAVEGAKSIGLPGKLPSEIREQDRAGRFLRTIHKAQELPTPGCKKSGKEGMGLALLS